ncbi:MAG TPA: hypothetical protein VFB98_09240 [Candidatus Deferrimicrobium sp.]|nr:hypothetical protein [Candidatus Deferrimicrobium sp.]
MRKTIGKVVLAVVIAGLLTGGIAIASAATKVRTITTAQGTSVDVISVTGTVTEVSTASTTGTSHGIMGMFRRGPGGYAKIKDNADGTVYTLGLGREETSGLMMKVGDIVTVEGTSATRNSVKDLQVWTFTGADGKTVTLRKADGTPNIETVSIAGTVTEVNVPTTTAPSTGDTTKQTPKAMATIKVNQADGTIVTVVLGHGVADVTVKVNDVVKIEGFKTPMDANTVMATSFTGADGKKVAIAAGGFRGGCGMGGDRSDGRGFRGGMMGPGSASDSPVPSST